MTMVQYSTPPRAPRTVAVMLGDDGPYPFTVPKVAPLVMALHDMQGLDEKASTETAVAAQNAWFERGFGYWSWAHIRRRVNRDDDPMGPEHLADLFIQLLRVAVTV